MKSIKSQILFIAILFILLLVFKVLTNPAIDNFLEILMIIVSSATVISVSALIVIIFFKN